VSYLTGKFEGQYTLNGEMHSDAVKVTIFDSGTISILPIMSIESDFAGIARSRRKVLEFMPFNKDMILTQTPEEMKKGFFYEIAGTKVGSIHQGPLGHPGDGEFYDWPIRKIRTDIQYSCDSIITQITGVTEYGSGIRIHTDQLNPIEFFLEFEIPREKMQSFFQYNDEVASRVNVNLDKLDRRYG
jgi:hypothetical protein